MNIFSKTCGVARVLALVCLFAASCRREAEVFPPEIVPVAPPDAAAIRGFYLLNEGNMGSNKATLDFMDLATGEYRRNIYASANPSVPRELGDVGNDLRICGGRLYAVINCSNKVEVMDKFTARRIGQIDIPNCRYIRFHDGWAYVSSYAGPVELDPDYRQLGYVARVDTATLQVVDRCLVGFQPEEMEIVGDKIYVTNSGGYMFPYYENTVSVIDIATFSEIDRIPVARNLHLLCADRHGNLWVSSRGDYYGQPSRLYRIDLDSGATVDSLDIAVSDFFLHGDSLYICSAAWNYVSMSTEVNYGIVDVKRSAIVSRSFISDGTDALISVPYGVAVHPLTGDIYVADAKNYVSPGALHCFDSAGNLKWTVRTGDIPAHFAFLEE